MTNIMDHNSKVDFINQCSRDLEKKLASENQKLHHWLHHDANHNQNGNHSQNGHHYQSQTASHLPQTQPLHHQQSPQMSPQNTPVNGGHQNGHEKHQFHVYEKKGNSKRVSPPHELVKAEGPKTETIPPNTGPIAGSITTWEWSGEFERVQAKNKINY